MKPEMAVSLKTKKLVAKVCTGLFFLCSGIEYAVILPTLNDYLKVKFDTKQFFYGMVLSAFSLSGLLVTPFFGMWYDRTHKTKLMIIFANMWEIGGNIMYFIGINEYFVLGGRFLAGVGAGVGSAIFAHVAQTTTEKERAAAISLLMGARQFGLLFGPGLNLGLQKCDFYIGRFHVNKYTSPGVFMAVLWILQQLLFAFVYFDVPTLEQQRKMEQADRSRLATDEQESKPRLDYAALPNGSTGGTTDDGDDDGTAIIEQAVGRNNIMADVVGGDVSGEYLSAQPQDEAYMQQRNGNAIGEAGDDDEKEEEEEKPPGFWWSLNECLKEEIVVLLAIQFVFLFNQPGLETAVVPLNEKYLNFDEIANSIFYCVCGAELLIFFMVVTMLSKKFSDRVILLIGLVIELTSVSLLAVFIPQAVPGDRQRNMPMFVSACAFQVSGLAFLSVAIISLFSKVVPEKIQGFSQGIRRATGGLATIMGPLWSGSTVEKPFLMLIVMVVLFALVVLMVLVSWKRLRSKAQRDGRRPTHPSNILSVNDDETKPLLPDDFGTVQT